ncbi:MAG: Gfo/Idh/MocA family protein [Leptolyngbyaceae cyanobacterium]
MANVLKAAVIGAGAISKEHLSFLHETKQARLVGVCDLSPAAAKYGAKRYEAEGAYTNYQDMLAQASPEVVHVLTPPHTHKMIATDCLKAGAHVICEKPITLTLDEFKELWQVAKDCDRRLMEDHNYLFNKPILAIQKMVQEGTLGEIQDVEIRVALNVRTEGGRFADENLPNPIHKMPAGVVHDIITHMVYLALPYLPSIDRVSAAWNNHGGGDLFKYDDLDALVIGGQTHVRLRFSAYTQPECFMVYVRGDRGSAETDIFQPYLRTVLPRSGGKQFSPLINHFVNGRNLVASSFNNFYRKVMQITPYEGLSNLLDKTYYALAHGQDLPIGYQQMERTLGLIEALLAEENRV